MPKVLTPDEQILHDIITNAVNVLRLSAGEKAKILAQLVKLGGDLTSKINDLNLTTSDKRKLKKFLKEANEIISDHYDTIADVSDLPEISETIADSTANSIEVALGAKALEVPTAAYFASVASNVLIQGAPSADWWRGQKVDLQNRFAQQVRMGLSAGETNQQIISRIVGKSGAPGIMDTARNNAAALVQTSVQTVANDARRATFQANSNVIKGIKQVSTLDSHTTVICVAYSGAEWNLEYEPINDNDLPYNNGTPRHWNCRSVEVPITKTFREMGIDVDEVPTSTRASVDGQISAKLTFNDFLKGKSKEFQDELLGPGRADLYRAGKITLRDLVSGDGNPLTLEQLRAKVARRK